MSGIYNNYVVLRIVYLQIAEDVHSLQQNDDEKKLRKIRRILQERWWHVDPSRIDIVARRLFPVAFAIFNIVYWVTYNYS